VKDLQTPEAGEQNEETEAGDTDGESEPPAQA
jgi:hypothetical protein